MFIEIITVLVTVFTWYWKSIFNETHFSIIYWNIMEWFVSGKCIIQFFNFWSISLWPGDIIPLNGVWMSSIKNNESSMRNWSMDMRCYFNRNKQSHSLKSTVTSVIGTVVTWIHRVCRFILLIFYLLLLDILLAMNKLCPDILY